MTEAYERYKSLDEGQVADYIPALARTPRNLFGACVVGIDGHVFAVGDTAHEFSIQSISKPFVFALISQAIGCEEAVSYTHLDVYKRQGSHDPAWEQVQWEQVQTLQRP